MRRGREVRFQLHRYPLQLATDATQPTDAGNFGNSTLDATHRTSPVRQQTTVTRTGERPIPAQCDLPNRPEHATRTQRALPEVAGPTRTRLERSLLRHSRQSAFSGFVLFAFCLVPTIAPHLCLR
jgi:hypothetical protein